MYGQALLTRRPATRRDYIVAPDHSAVGHSALWRMECLAKGFEDLSRGYPLNLSRACRVRLPGLPVFIGAHEPPALQEHAAHVGSWDSRPLQFGDDAFDAPCSRHLRECFQDPDAFCICRSRFEASPL